MHQSRAAALVNVGAVERGVSCFAGACLLLAGLRRRSWPLVLGGGALLYRGVRGFSPVYRGLDAYATPHFGRELYLSEAITIEKPVEEVYRVWRALEGLPRFMSHLESVTSIDERRSRWVARVPAPSRLEWEAQIIDEKPNEKIAWRSLPRSDLEHYGSVLFRPLTAREAAEIKLVLSYRPPAGRVGAAAATFLSGLSKHQIREDLRAFKALMETGETPVAAPQPSGARRGMRWTPLDLFTR